MVFFLILFYCVLFFLCLGLDNSRFICYIIIMCLFPIAASPRLVYCRGDYVYKSNILQYECGSCPECLRKRSSSWALRAVYESKLHAHNCMITLTYDNFVRDSRTGKIIGETIPDRDLKVNQRDVQLFIKRLRKHFFGSSKSDIKYIACAEYGSRTHRAHYHLILFGVRFDDFHYYKKSKRGNIIYMSQTLSNLWKNGICTIDSISVHSSIARYCTKYCAKSRSDKTFMLASKSLGLSALLKDFNGISYFIDGREYPVPKRVWQEVIYNRYSMDIADFRYVNKIYDDNDFIINLDDYILSCAKREMFRQIRDDDFQYQKYLVYWSSKGELYEHNNPSVLQRIYLLDDSKFHNYKIAALDCYFKRKGFYKNFPAPGSGCVSAHERDVFYVRYNIDKMLGFSNRVVNCLSPSCPNRAIDTKDIFLTRIFCKSPFKQKNIQFFLDFY